MVVYAVSPNSRRRPNIQGLPRRGGTTTSTPRDRRNPSECGGSAAGRLRDAAALPNVTVQVVPYDAGAHPGMPGSFIVLEFPDPADQGLVYLQRMAGDLFLEQNREKIG